MRATAYVHSMPPREAGPKADLEQLFSFYAARLRDFAITEEDAARERSVVAQEHDWRVGSSPFRRFQRQLDRVLLPDHPSGQWTIGTRESIDRFTLAEAKAFHRDWYVLNNVYFAVKGDIDAADLRAIAERALAGLETRPLPARAAQRQPQVPTARTDLRHADPQVRRAHVTYKKLVRLEEGSEELGPRAARAILMSYLASRLPGSPHHMLAEKAQLAAGGPSVSLNRAAPRTYVLAIAADVAPEASAEALLAGISAYVDDLGKSGVAPDVVERLQRRFAQNRASDDEDPDRVYRRLVSWLANRNVYADLQAWPGWIAAASPRDVAAIAAALAGPGNREGGHRHHRARRGGI
jgi:zinc protease